jgi:hypothetical protein
MGREKRNKAERFPPSEGAEVIPNKNKKQKKRNPTSTAT